MEPPAPAKIDAPSPLLAAVLARDSDGIRDIVSRDGGAVHQPDRLNLTPALAAQYLHHDMRQSLGLPLLGARPALIVERAGEGRQPLDAAAVKQLFGYITIDSLEWDSVDLLRKTLSAKKVQILQRVVQTGDLTNEPWLAYQLYLARSFGAQIDAGYHSDVYVAHVSDQVGWGVFAAQAIPKGTLVGEYVGVIRRAQPMGGDYACSYADLMPYCKLSVDAKSKGNWSRFVNHSSKRANLGWRDVFVNGVSHVVFVAQAPIVANEQLLVDYGSEYWATTGSGEPADL